MRLRKRVDKNAARIASALDQPEIQSMHMLRSSPKKGRQHRITDAIAVSSPLNSNTTLTVTTSRGTSLDECVRSEVPDHTRSTVRHYHPEHDGDTIGRTETRKSNDSRTRNSEDRHDDCPNLANTTNGILDRAYQKQQRIIESIEKYQRNGPAGYLEILRDSQIRDFCDYAPANAYVPLSIALQGRSSDGPQTAVRHNGQAQQGGSMRSTTIAPDPGETRIAVESNNNDQDSNSCSNPRKINNFRACVNDSFDHIAQDDSGGFSLNTLQQGQSHFKYATPRVEAMFKSPPTGRDIDRTSNRSSTGSLAPNDPVLSHEVPRCLTEERLSPLQDVLILLADAHLPPGFIAIGSPRPLKDGRFRRSSGVVESWPPGIRSRTELSSRAIVGDCHVAHKSDQSPAPGCQAYTFCHVFVKECYHNPVTQTRSYTFVMEQPGAEQ